MIFSYRILIWKSSESRDLRIIILIKLIYEIKYFLNNFICDDGSVVAYSVIDSISIGLDFRTSLGF